MLYEFIKEFHKQRKDSLIVFKGFLKVWNLGKCFEDNCYYLLDLRSIAEALHTCSSVSGILLDFVFLISIVTLGHNKLSYYQEHLFIVFFVGHCVQIGLRRSPYSSIIYISFNSFSKHFLGACPTGHWGYSGEPDR